MGIKFNPLSGQYDLVSSSVGGTLQDAYTGGNSILYDGSRSVSVISGGIPYGGSNFSLFSADSTFAAPFAVNYSASKRATGPTAGLPAFSISYLLVNDTAITFPSATSIEFGVDLVVAGAIPGYGTVTIKDSNVAGDESIYQIGSFSNGVTTNSIANISIDYKTFAPPTFTSTTGTAVVTLTGDAMGSTSNHFEAYSFASTNPSNGSLFKGNNEGGAIDEGYIIRNSSGTIGSGFSARNISGATMNHFAFLSNDLGGIRTDAMVYLEDNDATTTFPLFSLNNSGDASDFRLTNRTTDPSTPQTGDVWYNNSTQRFHAYNSVSSELAYLSDIVGVTYYDATVADSGADYTDIATAITAGKTRLLVSGNLTVSVSVAIPTAVTLELNILKGFTLTLNDGIYFSTAAAGSSHLIIEGAGTFAWANTTSARHAIRHILATNSVTIRGGLTLTNTSTNTSDYFTGIDATLSLGIAGLLYAEDVTINLNNNSGGGFYVEHRASRITDVTFVGGGVSSALALALVQGIASNIKLKGTFNTAANTITTVSGAIINGLLSYGAAASISANGGTFSDINSVQDSLNFIVSGNDVTGSNIYLSSGSLDLGSSVSTFVNTRVDGAVVFNAGTVANLTNCIFSDTTAVVIGGDRSKLNNVFFDSNVTINGDFNQIVSSQVGQSASSKTITLSATANKNLISNTFTDVAIVNNGTNTGISNVQTYS